MKHKNFIFQPAPSIFSAVAEGNINFVAKIIQKENNVNEHRSTDGFTPIFIAVSHNNPSMLQFLLDNGANPIAKSIAGMTALDLALSSKGFNPLLVKYLLMASKTLDFQEKFNFYTSSLTSAYNVDTVIFLRKYLDTSEEDFSSNSDNTSFIRINNSTPSSLIRKDQEAENYYSTPSYQEHFEHTMIVVGDSG